MSKYEGHTPSPWSVQALKLLLRFARKNSGLWDEVYDECMELLQDFAEGINLIPPSRPLAKYYTSLATELRECVDHIKQKTYQELKDVDDE